ncbi:oligosaccharide repeat unit polymerase [Pseudomonas sp. ANT_J12]|uniref:O-antigen polymerase n=1 Tax=Pseudomonas sp. ANT_J12 TaxID=2597351 RepID=UPI0011F3A93C|nr:O-antigen polymerase [Pseudomonas sp. ANT_J12]KAA0987722.1 oligosaccharide repeat unit polymerase [Pseudomonas sp. ANT_J12]
MLNPAFVYISMWSLVLLLYFFGLTTNLVPPTVVGLMVILMNMVSIFLLYVLLKGRKKNEPLSSERTEYYVAVVSRFFRLLLVVWLLGTVFEIYYSAGVPLYWRLAGINKLYTEFGVPSLHGVMNACYLQILSMATYLSSKTRSKKLIFVIAVLLLWPVLMLGRGILLSGLIQIVCVSLVLTKISYKKIATLVVVLLSVVVVFGYLGDMRQTSNPFSYLVSGTSAEVFDALPSGFLWFYVYLTAGLSNFFHNIDTVSPAWSVSYSMSNMLPSVVKASFGLDARNDLFTFVDRNLNTSTIYAGFVSDVGAFGGFLFVALIQLVCCCIYNASLKGKPWGIFAYSVAFQILVFSIFYDMFFLLPTLFQFFICFSLYVFANLRLDSQKKEALQDT